MDALGIAVFLSIVFALFLPGLQGRLKRWFHVNPKRIFLAPALLTLFFIAALAVEDAFSAPFALTIAAYTLAPTALVYRAGKLGREPGWTDFIAVQLLWLPVELTAGRQLIEPHARGMANHFAHGTAVSLALFLFLVFRGMPGMKYNPPKSMCDLRNPAIGFALAAPVLISLGMALSFIGPFQTGRATVASFATRFALTLVGVALPEELLFRSLIQNWMMLRFGASNRTLLAAALLFGSAHLNNSPGGFPNWRYMILATIAGFVYGKVFQKSNTILSSAGLHAFVNTVRHSFFV